MMQKKEILVLLSLVVIASGCAQTTSTDDTATTDSVAIQNFSSFPQEVYNDQQVRLTLTLINEGDTNAKNVAARLFNVPFSSDSGSNNNVWKLDGSRTISFDTLQAADEENNLPAREKNKYWTMTSPDLDNGVTIPYQFMTRIYYKYHTSGTSSITLMNQQRFREEGTSERPSLDTSSGPVQMEIRTQSPIVFYPEDEGDRQTEMCVVVRNDGEGTPFLHSEAYDDGSYDVTEDASNKVKLRVPDQGGIEFTPDDGSGNTAVVEMFGNRGIKCFTINVENWESGLGPQQEVPITMETIYGYYKEDSHSVTVQGSDRFKGSPPEEEGSGEGEWEWTGDKEGDSASALAWQVAEGDNENEKCEYLEDDSGYDAEKFCSR